MKVLLELSVLQGTLVCVWESFRSLDRAISAKFLTRRVSLRSSFPNFQKIFVSSAFCFPYNSVTVRRILFKFGRFRQ